MIRRHPLLWSGLLGIAAIAISGLLLTPGFSASFLTKKAAKRLFYTKTQADARFLNGDGETLVTASPLTWRDSNPANSVNFNPGADGTTFSTGGPDTDLAVNAPTLLPVVAGQPMTLVAVNACYATPNSTLDAVQVQVTDTATNNTTTPLSDGTDRTDDACRDYPLPTPEALDATDSVVIVFNMSFPGGGGNSFVARRATFTLTP